MTDTCHACDNDATYVVCGTYDPACRYHATLTDNAKVRIAYERGENARTVADRQRSMDASLHTALMSLARRPSVRPSSSATTPTASPASTNSPSEA